MRLISLLLGIFFEQALGFLDQKVYRYYVELQNVIVKIQNKFLISLALVLMWCSAFSAFLMQFGKNLDEVSGFHWTASLTLYLCFLILSPIGFWLINRSSAKTEPASEELDLEVLKSLIEEFTAQQQPSRPRRKNRTKRS